MKLVLLWIFTVAYIHAKRLEDLLDDKEKESLYLQYFGMIGCRDRTPAMYERPSFRNLYFSWAGKSKKRMFIKNEEDWKRLEAFILHLRDEVFVTENKIRKKRIYGPLRALIFDYDSTIEENSNYPDKKPPFICNDAAEVFFSGFKELAKKLKTECNIENTENDNNFGFILEAFSTPYAMTHYSFINAIFVETTTISFFNRKHLINTAISRYLIDNYRFLTGVIQLSDEEEERIVHYDFCSSWIDHPFGWKVYRYWVNVAESVKMEFLTSLNLRGPYHFAVDQRKLINFAFHRYNFQFAHVMRKVIPRSDYVNVGRSSSRLSKMVEYFQGSSINEKLMMLGLDVDSLKWRVGSRADLPIGIIRVENLYLEFERFKENAGDRLLVLPNFQKIKNIHIDIDERNVDEALAFLHHIKIPNCKLHLSFSKYLKKEMLLEAIKIVNVGPMDIALKYWWSWSKEILSSINDNPMIDSLNLRFDDDDVIQVGDSRGFSFPNITHVGLINCSFQFISSILTPRSFPKLKKLHINTHTKTWISDMTVLIHSLIALKIEELEFNTNFRPFDWIDSHEDEIMFHTDLCELDILRTDLPSCYLEKLVKLIRKAGCNPIVISSFISENGHSKPEDFLIVDRIEDTYPTKSANSFKQ